MLDPGAEVLVTGNKLVIDIPPRWARVMRVD
jgi:hypothetical protein